MINSSRKRNETKPDPDLRTKGSAGYFQENGTLLGVPSTTAVETQANQGPVPNGGYFENFLPRVAVFFSYGPSLEDLVNQDTLGCNVSVSFSYGPDFEVAPYSDALSPAVSLTFSYS